MVDYQEIYRTQGKQYHRLIAAEDIDNHLRPAMENVTPLSGKRILDLGAGTGRIPLLLPDAELYTLELNWSMLAEQVRQRERTNGTWHALQGDMRCLPFPAQSFEIITAGWSISNLTNTFNDSWKTEITKVLDGMRRLAKPHGDLIIIETMTTGSLTPAPPHERLAAYYDWLENKWGFTSQVIQTDYLFKSLEESIQLGGFFFGPDLAQKIEQNNWVRLPEWTGVWGKTL